MNWNTNNPDKVGNYIVDMGAWGVSLGWWNGNEWIKMWSNEFIKVYGWIEVPDYRPEIKINNIK
jgi:hypothetical protein